MGRRGRRGMEKKGGEESKTEVRRRGVEYVVSYYRA